VSRRLVVLYQWVTACWFYLFHAALRDPVAVGFLVLAAGLFTLLAWLP
jgi:hypothetical protein